MAMQQLADLNFNNAARITGLPAAVADGQPVVLEQLNAAIEGTAWKDSARVRVTANLNLAAPGDTLDGVAMSVNDRILAAGQTAGAENGVYIWNGAAVPMTRALDANTWAELVNAVVPIAEGTSAGTQWRQSAVSGTLGTDVISWVSFGAAVAPATESTAGVVELATQAEVDAGTSTTLAVTPATLAGSKYVSESTSQVIGDGTATLFTVTHNYNTRDVDVSVYRNSGNYDEVGVEVRRTTVDAVTVVFASPPAANAFAVRVSRK